MKFLSTVVVLVMCAVVGCALQTPHAIKRFSRAKIPGKPVMPSPSQRNYKIVLRKMEIDVISGSYLSSDTILKVVMFNETMTVISGKFVVAHDLPPNLQIHIVGYRFTESNQWMISFDQGRQNYCDYAEKNVSFMRNFLIASNFTDCPVKKGVYSVTNMVVDEKSFPPGLPETQFRIDASFTVENVKFVRLSSYADIVLNDDDYDDDE